MSPFARCGLVAAALALAACAPAGMSPVGLPGGPVVPAGSPAATPPPATPSGAPAGPGVTRLTGLAPVSRA